MIYTNAPPKEPFPIPAVIGLAALGVALVMCLIGVCVVIRKCTSTQNPAKIAAQREAPARNQRARGGTEYRDAPSGVVGSDILRENGNEILLQETPVKYAIGGPDASGSTQEFPPYAGLGTKEPVSYDKILPQSATVDVETSNYGKINTTGEAEYTVPQRKSTNASARRASQLLEDPPAETLLDIIPATAEYGPVGLAKSIDNVEPAEAPDVPYGDLGEERFSKYRE